MHPKGSRVKPRGEEGGREKGVVVEAARGP